MHTFKSKKLCDNCQEIWFKPTGGRQKYCLDCKLVLKRDRQVVYSKNYTNKVKYTSWFKELMNSYRRKYRKQNPKRYKAMEIVYHAKKNGQLKKKPCEICDSLESQAHHEDYNKPLEVRWLCLCCHQAYHSYLKAHPNGSLEAFPMSL